MADFSQKIGFKKGVVDHPFSPFVNLTIEEMKEAGAAGLWLNFTFDELSPLLGIDPANMYKAIRTVGPEHCTLSSDAGEPLFPELRRVAASTARLHVGFRLHGGRDLQDVHGQPGVHRRTQAGNEATGERGLRAIPEEPLGSTGSNEQVAEDRRNGSRFKHERKTVRPEVLEGRTVVLWTCEVTNFREEFQPPSDLAFSLLFRAS